MLCLVIGKTVLDKIHFQPLAIPALRSLWQRIKTTIANLYSGSSLLHQQARSMFEKRCFFLR